MPCVNHCQIFISSPYCSPLNSRLGFPTSTLMQALVPSTSIPKMLICHISDTDSLTSHVLWRKCLLSLLFSPSISSAFKISLFCAQISSSPSPPSFLGPQFSLGYYNNLIHFLPICPSICSLYGIPYILSKMEVKSSHPAESSSSFPLLLAQKSQSCNSLPRSSPHPCPTTWLQPNAMALLLCQPLLLLSSHSDLLSAPPPNARPFSISKCHPYILFCSSLPTPVIPVASLSLFVGSRSYQLLREAFLVHPFLK